MLIPRFRGAAVKDGDKFRWELIVTMLGNDDEGDIFGSIDSFNTKEEAIHNMKLAIKNCMISIAKNNPELGIDVNAYIDIKTNITRKWDKSDEN